MKNNQTKRSFWKLGKVLELFPGVDGSIRSAKVRIGDMDGKFGTKVLCRPLKLLVPLEVRKQTPLQQAPAQPGSQPVAAKIVPKEQERMRITRSKRNAAVIGEMLRRDEL